MTWPTVAKQAFAHYFTPYPISFTSGATNYTAFLTPGGTTNNGVSSAVYGGLLRDQPIPRAASTASNWAVVDMQTEVRNAIAGGLDGFTVDILNTAYGQDGHWVRQDNLMAAASQVSATFKVMPMFDMGPWASQTPAALAARAVTLFANASALTVSGKLVLSAFHAEAWSVANWNAAIAAIETQTGKTVAFVPCFLSQSTGTVDTYMAVTRIYGASVWGNRSPAGQTNMATLAAYAHSKGLIWMGPVSVQDERPNQAIYDEAVNTHNLEDSWAAACGYTGGFAGSTVTNGPADWVQIPTWNDFSEGAQVCPSVKHGWAYTNLSKYYCGLWKAGLTPATAPTPTVDQMFLTYRTQNNNATITGPQTSLMARRGGTSTASDLIEVLTLLTATSTLSINGAGGVSVPAGLTRTTTALVAGTPTATLTRAGTNPLTVTGPVATSSPVTSAAIQDEQYVAATAVRSVTATAGVLFGVTDSNLPGGAGVMVDTLEGAYTGGAGTGISNRIPIVHCVESWTTATSGVAAFGTGSRELALFNAGHSMVVSIGLPAGATPCTDITAGTYDTVLTTLGNNINGLGFGAAVSGTQPGQAYGGVTASSVRIAFYLQMDTDTTHGTVAQQQAAYRYVCAKIASRLSVRSKVVFVWAPSGGAAANGKATTTLPGLTATDFVDEIGVCYPVNSTTYTTFASDIGPWKTWLAANAPTRKFIPIKMAVHVDAANSAHQGTYMTGVVTELQNNPTLYSGLVWDALPTGAIDDRNPAKSNNSLLFTAFHDAVAASIASGSPVVDVTPPPAPTGLSATAQTTTTCTLTWQQQSVPDLAGFQVIVDGAVVTTTSTPAVLTYTATGLTAASLHNFGVAAVDTSGNVSLINNLFGVAQPGTGALLPPTISASIVMNGLTGAASATVTDPSAGLTVVTWNWGDGTTDVGVTQSHTWAPGSYTATATVMSLASNLSTPQTINVVAAAPAATPNIGFAQLVPGQTMAQATSIINGNSALADAAITSFTPTATKTAAYIATAGDLIPVDVSAGNVTVTLPTSAADKAQIIAYLKAFTAGNVLTIAAAGADVIETSAGTATTATRSAGVGESIWVQYDQTNGLWRQMADRIPITLLGRARAVVAQAYAATITPVVTGSVDQILNVAALTGALTLAAPTGTPADAQLLKIRFVQDGTGGRVVTFNAAYAFGTDVTAALVPTTASAKWEMVFEWNATDSKWRAVAIARGF